MDNHKIGIVVLNFNTWKETIECISSIKKCTVGIPYTIYIVDNASTDDSLEQLNVRLHMFPDAVLIPNHINQGYSTGNNVGIKQAIQDNCTVVYIVNSDVELLNNAFYIMTKELCSNENYMMIGPSIIDNENEESQLPRKKLTFWTFVFSRQPFCKVPIIKSKINRCLELPLLGNLVFDGSVSGCCFGMRAQDFMKINFFDENVFLYYEEDILAYKMKDIHKKAVVNVEARIWHKANVSTSKKGKAFVQFHRWLSALYLLKQYAKISRSKQILVAVWNTLTWSVLSIFSKQHRTLLIQFLKKNFEIVLW